MEEQDEKEAGSRRKWESTVRPIEKLPNVSPLHCLYVLLLSILNRR